MTESEIKTNKTILIRELKKLIFSCSKCYEEDDDESEKDETIYRINAETYFFPFRNGNIITIDIYGKKVNGKIDLEKSECAIDYSAFDEGPFAVDIKDMTLKELSKLYTDIKKLN